MYNCFVSKVVNWNPWHGCTKYSAGCKFCYVYRHDERYGSERPSNECHKNSQFNLPIAKKRDGLYKVEPGSYVYTCFTSDFLLKDADGWRDECWKMIKERSDCLFYFFTKRIERLEEVLPDDWGDGYANVKIGCTVENQDRADFRLPIFMNAKIRHKAIIVGPMLENVDISAYLDDSIEEVSASGESGNNVRPCHYDWVLNLRRQCIEKDVTFLYHQTGATLIKDGVTYHIPRIKQIVQAHKANIDYHSSRKRTNVSSFDHDDTSQQEQLSLFG